MYHFLLQANPQTFLNVIAQQGPVVCLLALAIWYFYNRVQKLETAVQESTDKLEKYMLEDRQTLSSLVRDNTEAYKDVKLLLQSQLNKAA